MAARRIGPLYNQAGVDYEKIGKLTAQTIDAEKLLYQNDNAGSASSGKAGSGSAAGSSGHGGKARMAGDLNALQDGLDRAAGRERNDGWRDVYGTTAAARDLVTGNRGGFVTYPGADTQSGRGMYTPDPPGGQTATSEGYNPDTKTTFRESSTNSGAGQDYSGGSYTAEQNYWYNVSGGTNAFPSDTEKTQIINSAYTGSKDQVTSLANGGTDAVVPAVTPTEMSGGM